MQIIKSPSNDPLYNLALERSLLEERSEDFLLLYINTPSVIVGRNQLEEAEADLIYCAAHHIPVIKRISGGGTVYHDLGNINYAFITARSTISILDSKPLTPIQDALASFGIPTEVGKRGELLTNNLKISGTASYSSSRRQLFHGTLLHNTDLNTLHAALNGNPAKRGKRIASVPSPVINLSAFPSLSCSTEEFLERLFSFFITYYNQSLMSPLTYPSSFFK